MRLIHKISPILDEDEVSGKNVLTDKQKAISEFLTENERRLLKSIFYFVKKAGVWRRDELGDITAEIWSETKRTALEKAEQLDFERQPLAWILKTAHHYTLRHSSSDRNRKAHETLAADSKPDEIEIFDKLDESINKMNLPDDIRNWQSWKADDAARIITQICERQQIKILLAPCKAEEKQIIIFAVIYELSSKEMGRILGISPAAARQRLARALGKLRGFWQTNKNNENDRQK